MKYQNAKIYKIVNSIDKLIYVGSTIQPLNIRFTGHKSRSKQYPERKLYKHFAKLGVEHFKIVLIKLFPCADKLELEIEEERYKQLLNAQLNTYRAHQTAEQKKEQTNETNKKYRENNRAKINLKQNEYYKNNRAKFLLKQNERILCKICGKTYTRSHKSQHCKSKHHQTFVKFNQSKNETDAKYTKYVQFNNSI
jgi:hypothetical protein